MTWPAERPWTESLRDRRCWARAFLFAIGAVIVAGGANAILYALEPTGFAEAYRWELEGTQFIQAQPIVTIGRFGFDPVYFGRSFLELVRDAPLLMSLTAFGLATAVTAPLRVPIGVWLWVVVGVGFVAIQNYQPMRYYFLVAPAFCWFAAAAVSTVGRGTSSRSDRGPWRRAQLGFVAAYAAFNVAYLGMNAVANSDLRHRHVRNWASANIDPDARLMMARYLGIDLPNPAWGQFSRDSDDPRAVLDRIRDLGIDFVIVDYDEWGPEWIEQLEDRFRVVHEWPFGRVYAIGPAP